MAITLKVVATPQGRTALRIDIENEMGSVYEIVEMEEMERFASDVCEIESLCYSAAILQKYLMQQMEMNVESSAYQTRIMLGIATEEKQKKQEGE